MKDNRNDGRLTKVEYLENELRKAKRERAEAEAVLRRWYKDGLYCDSGKLLNKVEKIIKRAQKRKLER